MPPPPAPPAPDPPPAKNARKKSLKAANVAGSASTSAASSGAEAAEVFQVDPPRLPADAAGSAAEATPIGRSTAKAGPVVRLPVGAELVVLLSFRRVGQDGMRLVDVLEPPLGGHVIGVAIRMELAREAAVGLLDLGLRRRLRHAQERVVVLVLHPDPLSEAA